MLFTLSLLAPTEAFTQAEFKVICLGFYNFENLFDPADDPHLDDAEFTAAGSNHYTDAIYHEKLEHLATVVSQLGTELTPDGIALLGVSELENRHVLEDFILQPVIRDRGYRIVHFDSRDHRGIDVGLLYQGKYFQPDSTQVIPLIIEIKPDGDTSYSRDILVVYGKIDGEAFAVTVNHWPSRRGGERATAHLRNKAAQINKELVDRNTAAGIKTIVMGDLNDDPVNESVKGILRAQPAPKNLRENEMFNPFYNDFRRGNGTTAYQDAWSLFDQVILSSNLIGDEKGYHFYRSRVFNEPFLTQKLGQYKGYPFRTYSGNTYIGGYSDHFPVYIFLIKRA